MAGYNNKPNIRIKQHDDEYTGMDYLVDAVVGIMICALVFLALIYG